MRNVQHKAFPSRLVPVKNGLLILANVFEGLLIIFTDTGINIKSQIVSFSLASYSLFYLYSGHSVKIIPNQLYHDLQSTFIDALFCCAKAKIFFPNDPLYLVLNGTDPLERIFGILHIQMKNLGMDYLPIKCDKLLSYKHLDWLKKSRSSRRLCLDYSNPKQWNEDNLKLGVDVHVLWEAGHMKARSQLLELGMIKSEESVDLLALLVYSLKKPEGKLIGVNEVDPDVSVGKLIVVYGVDPDVSVGELDVSKECAAETSSGDA